jgi:hypothetical protein
MHAGEQGDAPQEFSAVGAQGAAGVGDRFARQPVAYAAGDARGDPAKPGVLPFGAHAADHIVTVQTVEKPGNVRRVVLQVGVEGDDEAAAGRAEACGQGRRLARVAAQADDPHAQVLAGELAEGREAAVAAAVVDVDHLAGTAEGAQDALKLGREERQARLLVEHRDDDGDLGARHGGILPPPSQDPSGAGWRMAIRATRSAAF